MEELQAKPPVAPGEHDERSTKAGMKILFFMESLHGGGKERRSVELIRYLKEQREEYDIELVLTEEEIYYDDIYKAGVRIHILKRKGMKYDPGIVFKFLKICRQFNPDLLHAWGKMATFYAIPSRLICGVPLISSLIADSQRSYGRISRYALLRNINVTFSDVVLSNSLAGLKEYSIPRSKGRVIYNGVRLSRFDPPETGMGPREEFGITTRFLVIMVATFSHFKDYDLFVDVAKKTGTDRKDVTFMAVGDGPDLERIRARIAAEGITNIVLPGRRKDIERLVAASDVGLLCTRAEGISNSIIEYMASGKPVIATDITGGSRELVDEGKTGYCVERDASGTAALINRLLDDEQLRFSMGSKGRERIRNLFSIDRMGQEFQSLYRQTAEGKVTGRAAAKPAEL
jgi:glycosyltransferase involved in cell wall biosynthesis